jgi:hypothetical protein
MNTGILKEISGGDLLFARELNDTITVKFIHVSKNKHCKITPEQLNMLLGLNIPKYSILEGTKFPYLFCVNTIININSILNEYGYEVGHSGTQKIFKSQFNKHHVACVCNNGSDCYELEKI